MMGLSGVGPGSILLILLIIILLFGSKRIASIARDLAKGIKSFRSGLNEKEGTEALPSTQQDATSKEDSNEKPPAA